MTAPIHKSTGYTRTAIALHWLLAVAIIGTFALGVYMHELPVSPSRLKLYNWHKWAGISILTLSAVRLLWRLTHRPPPDVAMPAWQARLAHAAHALLYVLFFATPLSGWAYSSAAGFAVVVFGVLPLPDLMPVDESLAEMLKGVHKLCTISLGLLVIVHVLGALKHQLIDRDGLLARMSFRNTGGKVGMKAYLGLNAFALVAAMAGPACAQAKLVPAQSEIAFTSRQMGVPVDGRFKTFSAQINFDPKKPEVSRIAFSVDLLSAAIGDAETMAELAKPAWFDSRKMPQATFESASVKAAGPGRFEVAGRLAIKGSVRDVTVPVVLAQTGGQSTATGSFVIKRLDFRIGDGDWADTSLVANDVQVKFKLVLTGVGAM